MSYKEWASASGAGFTAPPTPNCALIDGNVPEARLYAEQRNNIMQILLLQRGKYKA